jgi:glycerophosphoryl diester phosphodiesterase
MPLRIGHRGAAGHEPENTLKSFEHAIGLGVDFIEMDLQMTRDGHIVVVHDKRVDRTTDGEGYVASMSLAELRRLDAGKGERIPTLQEVLDLTTGRVGLMLELIAPNISGKVIDLVQQNFQGEVIYASFLHAEVAAIRRLSPGASTLALLEGVPVRPTVFATDARATHVGLSIESITENFLSRLREDGLLVFVYTANDPRDIGWLRDMEVDGIISDYPERI